MRSHALAPLALLAAAMVAAPTVAASGTPAPTAAAAAATAAAPTVFRCATRDGRTVFSDEPCTGASQVQVWKPRIVASGIERSGGPAGSAAPARAAEPSRHDPFVDCQRRGGHYELTARICRLPDDAARQMFRKQ